jgi:hypothetical protein
VFKLKIEFVVVADDVGEVPPRERCGFLVGDDGGGGVGKSSFVCAATFGANEFGDDLFGSVLIFEEFAGALSEVGDLIDGAFEFMGIFQQVAPLFLQFLFISDV